MKTGQPQTVVALGKTAFEYIAERPADVLPILNDDCPLTPDSGYGILRADYAERIGRQRSAIGIQHKRPVRARQLSQSSSRRTSLLRAISSLTPRSPRPRNIIARQARLRPVGCTRASLRNWALRHGGGWLRGLGERRPDATEITLRIYRFRRNKLRYIRYQAETMNTERDRRAVGQTRRLRGLR